MNNYLALVLPALTFLLLVLIIAIPRKKIQKVGPDPNEKVGLIGLKRRQAQWVTCLLFFILFFASIGILFYQSLQKLLEIP